MRKFCESFYQILFPCNWEFTENSCSFFKFIALLPEAATAKVTNMPGRSSEEIRPTISQYHTKRNHSVYLFMQRFINGNFLLSHEASIFNPVNCWPLICISRAMLVRSSSPYFQGATDN
jgi:hypothetical protein